ncbi:uncharacterized protein BCR38DRAFT_409153 [Pseudomassariella vexata]|uniref:Phospholipase D1 n=1 Tax=Pseudomassariella vexata TaxID=1141098 RepID=A0A1Y2E1N5_9PEZI|nr:uncharacterized protein BCR38DRAFT_409153 [Pseudomassariella vexata]ORY65461.1 hypothetical protein BCR38DRAFT_409153 [Pseudomassariella vexata]
MSALERDDSVSPTTSPMTLGPETERFNTRPTVLRASSGPAPTTKALSSGFLGYDTSVPESPVENGLPEAPDYLNGGLPHKNPSPAATSQPASPRRHLVAQGSGYSDVSPADFVSPSRRSVQFARADVVFDAPSPPYAHTRHDSWDGADGSGKSRGERLMSKLKYLAATGVTQTIRSPAPSEHVVPSSSSSPVLARPSRVPDTLNEEGSDADVEESGDEDGPRLTPKPSKRKRMRRRLKNLDLMTAPSTPRINGEDSPAPGQGRFRTMVRRSTMPDSTERRGGLSEGEGRDHLTGGRRGWTRGSSWMTGSRDDLESPSRMPGHRRRISDMFGSGGVSDGEALATPRRPIFGTDRATTFGVQRWKQVKNTLKMLGKKRTEQFDMRKSAELMAELRAVTPAVVMLASMLQRDEHGNRRIPVLLEQLKLRIIDSQPSKGDNEEGQSDRHYLFTIALEYGSGPSRMTWTIQRSIRDIAALHGRYKLSNVNNNPQVIPNLRSRTKQPAFPSSVFPWLRSLRGGEVSEDEEKAPEAAEPLADETAAEATAGEMTAAEGTASEMDRPSGRPSNAKRKRSRIHLLGVRRQSSGLGEIGEGSNLNPQKSAVEAALMRRKFVEKQRRVVEKYLQDMIHWLMFRPDSNRLCKFLELSALGVRLAAEGNYHGKECFLHLGPTKGIDFRRVLTPAKFVARHTKKWFLVRQNYIVVCESPSTMNIYDVYLVDPKFHIVSKGNKLKQLGAKAKAKGKSKGKGKGKGKGGVADDDDDDDDDEDEEEEPAGTHHSLKIYTSERKVKVWAYNQHIIHQFEQSVTEMLKQTTWAEPHRFDSFAPVRSNAFARWLVDGRDYMWNVSRAISMAQDVIYIHDWWLSPELYMRRPPAISGKWRLDRLLQRKAREGVKVFVIVYRNVEQAIPIDSEYTKFSLLNLHPNIMVQRSPNQLKKNQFFYAHHEKICVVDHDIAFVGGIDLCFGRWDNPQHPLTDDRPTGYEPGGETPKDAEHCQLFPGKDYSNPRVLDFFKLDEPYEEMYNRSKVPRMPWHDVAMQVVGQPARDLTRHFVQRWNYLRRERKPTRPMPFLLPPPDASPADLEELGLTGSCNVQILRSAGDWSLGFPKDVLEMSIQSAYIKLIEESEHFVYMENQFFITSTETMNTKVINRIGDALVERIIRAAANDEEWRCCILIPLMPGFQNTVDQDSGSSVRLIMQFQYRSICRGPDSIFGRLRAAQIEPEDYISFFSLRQWGKIGPNNNLVTEQLYIHAKTIIVDDRVALIGSANINERSMNGNRDSECAAIVSDTDMIQSTMGGEPYQVGRFAHTLRMRLMREHLGLDVDAILEEETRDSADAEAQYEEEMSQIYGDEHDLAEAGPSSLQRPQIPHGSSFNHDTNATHDPGFTSSSSSSSSSANSSKGKSAGRGSRKSNNKKHNADVEGYGPDNWRSAHESGLDRGRDTVIINGRETLIAPLPGEVSKPASHGSGWSGKEGLEQELTTSNDKLPPQGPFQRQTTSQLGLPPLTQVPDLPVSDDTDIGGPPLRLDESGHKAAEQVHPLAADIQLASIDKDCMRDPVNPAFWDEIWSRVAANNTKLYRRVFRCMPDSEVLTWSDYTQYMEYSNRFHENMTGQKKYDEHEVKPPNGQPGGAGGAGAGIAAPSSVQESSGLLEKVQSTLSPDTNPTVVVSHGDGPMDEKNTTPETPQKPNLHLDTEKVANHRPADAPSPVQPAGDIPFPAFDGQADTQLLEPTSTQNHNTRDRRTTFSSVDKPTSSQGGASSSTIYNTGSTRRRRRATTKGSRRGAIFPYDVLGREEAEELCGLIQGHLVQFSYDWLEAEEKDNHWLYQTDLMAPKEIYD